MRIGFTEALPPASAEQIEEVERRLGLELPEDYRRFLSEHNGAYLDDNFLPPGDASARYLYSAGPNDHEYISDVETELNRMYRSEDASEQELPTGFLDELRPIEELDLD